MRCLEIIFFDWADRELLITFALGENVGRINLSVPA